MTGLYAKAKTAFAVGLPNILQVAVYKGGIKTRIGKATRITAETPTGPFFTLPTVPTVSAAVVRDWWSEGHLFSSHRFALHIHPPDWLANPITGRLIAQPERNWWQIRDFDPTVGDIKLIWELSRMDWVLAFAQRARNGDKEALLRLNRWLADWCHQNQPYRGPNWKCGQEASIRVMHLAIAALVMGQVESPEPQLGELIRVHLQRIEPTLRYAMAQDNNHGTSEAAALFIGGSWLAAQGMTEGHRWSKAGRKWLENRARRLIGQQGGFSQYSCNYHRMMLDTFSMAEVWRRQLSLPAFSDQLVQKLQLAARWLHNMTSPLNGDVPNLGANDGARLLQLTDTGYRDYRPCVQLATALFANQCAYGQEGAWNEPLHWLGVPVPTQPMAAPATALDDDGGFAVIHNASAMAVLRYPRFRFRPSQADALHLDFWLNGENLLCDAGSFSYNTEARWLTYFSGTASHNTVQFDDRDQMPRVGRFLMGDWLKTTSMEPIRSDSQGSHFSAGYCDSWKACHRRRMSLGRSTLKVVDEVQGFAQKAVLRWRLAPGFWKLEHLPNGTRVTNGLFELTVSADVSVRRCELVEGWQSRHYIERTAISVLEVEIGEVGTLTSTASWSF